MNAPTSHFERFARVEAHGSSPTYEAWALGVAGDPELLDLVGSLPERKRQANLVFAAARSAGASDGPFGPFREWLISNWDRVASIAMRRSTQTNEAARCAVLLPQLETIGSPIALLEVGASAGVCLYPDRYSYRYSRPDGTVTALDPPDGVSDVILPCSYVAEGPPPRALPHVVWRAGIDLNPLDLSDPEDRAWLQALVWPEHDVRRDRLAAAAAIVAADPPMLVAGDLNDRLVELASRAPADAELVVFHSAVLAYLTPEERDRFRRTVREVGATWLSNEGIPVLPDIADGIPGSTERPGDFLLSRDGRPVAFTGPHGQHYRALPH